jgi:hypothetical protein
LDKWLADNSYSGDKFATAFAFRPEIDLHTGIRRETDWILGRRLSGIGRVKSQARRSTGSN